jgi:hypothetical protein
LVFPQLPVGLQVMLGAHLVDVEQTDAIAVRVELVTPGGLSRVASLIEGNPCTSPVSTSSPPCVSYLF